MLNKIKGYALAALVASLSAPALAQNQEHQHDHGQHAMDASAQPMDHSQHQMAPAEHADMDHDQHQQSTIAGHAQAPEHQDLAMVHALHQDDPPLLKLMAHEFEWRDADHGDPVHLDAAAWLGKDLHKLWLKVEAEAESGELEEAQLQLLYSRAIAPYWDLQVGVRHDLEPNPEQSWAVLGVQGLAPYFFEVDAALFLGEGGMSAARLEAEYEILFTQRLILSPEIEVNLYGRNDAVRGYGSGLADISAGFRLRYEIRREIAPYIGLNWQRKYGNTADFARLAGEAVEDTQLVLGIRLWF